MSAWLTTIPLLADWATWALNDLNPNNRFALLVVVVGCATGVLCTLLRLFPLRSIRFTIGELKPT